MRKLAGTAMAGLLMAAPTWAHHSAAMFDRTRTITLSGVVKDFQWTNPHSWLHVSVPDGKGGQVDWSIEMTSPNLLVRAGWRPSTLKAGDKITVTASPLRDGGLGGQFRTATLSDGRQLSNEAVSAASATPASR